MSDAGDIAPPPAPVVLARMTTEERRALALELAAVLREQGLVLAAAPAAPVGLLDARGAGRHLNMSRATFDRRVRPYVAAVDTGGHLRYRATDLDEWSASRSRAVPPRGITPRARLRPVGREEGR